MTGRRARVCRLTMVFIIAFGVAHLAAATPPVSWSQPSLSATVPPGGSTRTTITLRASEALGPVTLRVVPEIAPYVQLEPASFSNIAAGDIKEIVVTFRAPAAEGMFDGTLQVRGKKTFARPLPITLTVRQDSLVGTDSNGNGVWDYVEEYVTQKYASSPATVALLNTFARHLQSAIVLADDRAASIENATTMFRSIECLHYLRPTDFGRVTNDVKGALLNNMVRSRAYIHFGDQLAGQVFLARPAATLPASCGF